MNLVSFGFKPDGVSKRVYCHECAIKEKAIYTRMSFPFSQSKLPCNGRGLQK